jgi:hypothetical protein
LKGKQSAPLPLSASSSTVPWRPDKVELWVRFVCGALFGRLAGVGAFLSKWQSNGGGGTALTIIAAVGVAAGWCAARYGDRFWYGVFQVYYHGDLLKTHQQRNRPTGRKEPGPSPP